MLYSFFWVIPQRLNFYMGYKIQTPGNRPKERIQQSTAVSTFMHIGLMYFHLF